MAKKQFTQLPYEYCHSPRHSEISECFYLLNCLYGMADYETGVVYGWTDQSAADALGMKKRTIKDQRQKLDRLGYIDCQQRRDYQDITLRDWHVPGHWDTIVNPSVHVSKEDTEMSPLDEKDTGVSYQEDTKEDTKDITSSVPLSSKSENKKHKDVVVSPKSDEQGHEPQPPEVGEHVMYFGTEEPAACPQCHVGMVVVKVRRSDGKKFLGCSNYPTCKWTGDVLGKIMKPRSTPMNEDDSAYI